MFRGHFQCFREKQSKLCQKCFVWQMTKFNFVFPNYCFLKKVLRAFQVSRDHFQCFRGNKVKLCFKALFKVKQRQSDIPRRASWSLRSRITGSGLKLNFWVQHINYLGKKTWMIFGANLLHPNSDLSNITGVSN